MEPRGRGFTDFLAESDGRVVKYWRLGIHFSDLPDPADPPDLHKMMSASAARTLPSTRAGGQDDGS